MAITILPVQSGDIITANFMNQLLQALTALDGRVTVLEAGGTTSTNGRPKIGDFSPKTDLHEGDPLTITGQNLWAAGLNTVSVLMGSSVTPVTNFDARSDSLLIFKIPGVFAQSSGSQVSVQVVSPSQGGDSISFTLFPAKTNIPKGDIRVQLSSPPNITFNAGTGGNAAVYTLSYTLNANTTLDDTYDLIPSVDGVGWQTVILDDTSSPPQVEHSATVFIKAAPSLSQPTIVKGHFQLSIPSGATGSANLLLEVRSHLNPAGLDKFSAKAVIPVGGKVLLSDGIGIVPSPGSNVDSNGNFLVPAGAIGATLNFIVTTANAGNYLLGYRFDNDTGNWHAPVPPNSSEIDGLVANVGTPISVVVRVDSGSAQPSNLYLAVTKKDDSSVATEVFYPVKVK